jgi:hypothetical protein
MATNPFAGPGATPGRENMGSDVPMGIIERVATGIKYMVSGVGPMNFFGPQQPLQPQAQERSEGRAFDYPVGYNLRIQPREGENISFGTLRALADGYDLLRLIIETRKDQVESFEWEIVPRNKEDSADSYKDEIRKATEFFERPDKEHDWAQWLRMQVEDLLVIDAVCVYPRANRAGGLYALELVDAATIKRVLDDGGRTPLPPSVAYQQVLKGIPAGDYSADSLIYMMRNPRTNRIYGYSPVEQIVLTVNIAMRRQLSQLDFYTAGNIPEAIAQVPENWTASQISEFQLWWDATLEGNSAAKRKMRFIPSLDNIVFPKDQVLKDEMDEWLARIISFAFSTTPMALMKQVNRASGEQMADTAKEEGLLPLLRFLETHISRLLQRYLGCPGLKFKFKVTNKLDGKAQMEVHTGYIAAKVLTPEEVREDLGKDALTPEQMEAAFPTPPAPVVLGPDGLPLPPEEQPEQELGPDGKPLPAKPLAGAALATAQAKGKVPPVAADPSVAEKLLERALGMLDPERVGTVMEKMLGAAAQRSHVPAPPPQVIELRPEINVEVGDTNVHVPAPRPAPIERVESPAPVALDFRLTKRVVGRRMADGSLSVEWVDKEPDFTIQGDNE